MKHEGDMPVTIKCTVVFSGDTGYQEKDQRVCLHVKSAVVGTNLLFVSSSNLENDQIQ